MIRKLNRKFTLEALSASPDGAGGIVESWSPVAVLAAELKASSGRERETGGRASARVTHRAWLRYLPFGHAERPQPDQRFREGERAFAIRGVAEADEERRYLVCWLEEGALS
ncbi:MAG: phage head closure protein [Pseudomonadota bacterium]